MAWYSHNATKLFFMKLIFLKAVKLGMIAVLFSSCVAKKYLTAANDNIQRLQNDSSSMASNISKLSNDKSKLTDDVSKLNNLNGDLQKQLSTAQS